jgi:hypothetical protein
MKLGDSGAILVEFAVILPVLLLLTLGMFEVGVTMVQSLQLTYTTQAAFGEVNQGPGSGISWATLQLPSATFGPFSPPPAPNEVCVTASMPVKTMILPLPSLSALACWPKS